MDIFIEKVFIENFEREDVPDKRTNVQKVIYALFTKYTSINLFTNANFEWISESELLSKFSDNNTNIKFDINIQEYLNSNGIQSSQTLIFTKNPHSWLGKYKEMGVLCFDYGSYSNELHEFMENTHFKIDLSDEDNLPFKWDSLNHLRMSSSIIISDRFILKNTTQQKIRENIAKLLNSNLLKDKQYSLFIFTSFDKNLNKESINQKIQELNNLTADLSIKIFVINKFKNLEVTDLHDRNIYTHYTLIDSGIGFNLKVSKPSNSQLISESIFDYYTFKRYKKHIQGFKKYLSKLKTFEHYGNPFDVNSRKVFEEFESVY